MEEIIDWTAYFADLESQVAGLDARIKKARTESRTTDLASARNRYAIDQMEAEAVVLKEKISKGKANAPGQNKPPDPEPPPVEEPPVEPPVEPEPEPEPELPPGEDPEIPPGEEEPPIEDPEDPVIPEKPPAFPDPGVDPTAKLPQDHAYQRALYANLLKPMKQADVELAPAYPRWDGTYPNRDWLCETWMEQAARAVANELLPVHNPSGVDPFGAVMGAKARYFTLEGITDVTGSPAPANAPKANYCRRFPAAAYWYAKSLPMAGGGEGNPYRGSTALALRVLVTVAVDMMLTDWWHAQKSNPWPNSTGAHRTSDPRWLGFLLLAWIYSFRQTRHVVHPTTQAAFMAGFVRMTEKLKANGPSRNTPNMQTAVLPAMVHLWQIGDAETKALAMEVGKQFFDYLYKKAGYIHEGGSPETTYNGKSLYHFVEARAVSAGAPEWAFLDESLKEQSRFRSHQIFPVNADGSGEIGPSAYAGRTGGGYDALQASHPWRDMTLAAHYDEALPFHGLWIVKDLGEPAKLVSQIKNMLRVGGRRDSEQWDKIGTQDTIEWMLDHDHHWPGYWNYAPWKSGWYDRLLARVKANDPLCILPFKRSGHFFQETFDGEFLSRKAHDGEQAFGYFLESVPNGGTYGGYRGGSLQSFWTEKTGPIILGRKNKSENERKWPDISIWPTHHVFGRTAKGWWSTAVQRKRTVEHQDDGSLVVSGYMDDAENQNAPVNTNVEVVFTPLAKGLHIRHDLLETSGEAEAWAGLGNIRSAAAIEFATNGGFQLVGTNLVEARFVRLTFNSGSILLVLDDPTPVRLSPREWVQTYQGNIRLRGVHFDAMAGVGFEMVTRQ